MRIDKLAMTSREALQTAMSTAADAQAGAVEPIHLLSALLGAGERNISVIIERIGADPAQLARSTQDAIDHAPKVSGEGQFEALEQYGRNICDLARAGKLDPVIGRTDEIRRTIQVLSRRTKNNPVLIGEPGVGKTAIVRASPSVSWPATCRAPCATATSSSST